MVLIGFGKYKNIDTQTVIMKDPSYGRWLLSLNDLSPNLRKDLETAFRSDAFIALRKEVRYEGMLCLSKVMRFIHTYYSLTEICINFGIFKKSNHICIPKYAFITDIHKVNPQLTGQFIDYIVRISIDTSNFIDNRVEHEIDSNTRAPLTLGGFWGSWGDELVTSYERVRTKVFSARDVFITSLAHGAFFNRFDSEENIKDILTIISQKEDQIIQFQKEMSTRFESAKTNPVIGGKGIGADCDLIINDTLVDIKCQATSDVTIHEQNILQLFAYAVFAEIHRKYKINKLQVFNPLIGKLQEWDISSWGQKKRGAFYKFIYRHTSWKNLI